MICSAVRSRKRGKQVAWWIEREPRGWSSTSMVRVRLPASAPYPRQKRCHLSFDGWMKSVPLVTRGASEGKSCVPAPSSVRPTPPNGSARLATEAMGSTEWNCARPSGPSVATSQRTSSRRSTPCCASMDNMARGLCLQTWLASHS